MGARAIWRLSRAMAWLAGAGLALGLAAPARAADDPYEPKSIRWEEDFSALAQAPPVEPSRLEALKFTPLTADRDAWLSLGGEVRQRLDIIVSPQLGLSPAGSYDSAQTRLYLHGDLHLAGDLRLFGQLSYADEGGRRPTGRSFDESAPDWQQLFVEFGPRAARLRIGRQELPLGDQRLSEVRETFDLRRSFDAVRLDLTAASGARLTAFSGSPVLNRPDAFDDRRVRGETFQGLYAVLPGAVAGGDLDLFWLRRRRPASTYLEGAAPERRDTFGLRLHGQRGAFDYNLYALAQTGDFGGRSIRAYAASADLGWRLADWPWSPHLSVRTDIASGDRRQGDGRLETFDAPYPNTSYLSTSSAYFPGNAISVFPLLTLRPNQALSLYVGGQVLARQSRQDGFYYSAQSPIALPAAGGRVTMSQAYARLRWQPDRYWVFSMTAIRQVAGDPVVLKGGRDSTILSMSADWKF